MEAVVLILTVYCGTPVSAFLTYPKDGQSVVSMGPVDASSRQFYLDLEEKIKASPSGQVHRIEVARQVEGVRCPVST